MQVAVAFSPEVQMLSKEVWLYWDYYYYYCYYYYYYYYGLLCGNTNQTPINLLI